MIAACTTLDQMVWDEVVELLDRHFSDMIEARREVVLRRVGKQIAGRRGGLAAH